MMSERCSVNNSKPCFVGCSKQGSVNLRKLGSIKLTLFLVNVMERGVATNMYDGSLSAS